MITHRAIIVDDEQPARELLRVYLHEVPGIEVVGEAENGFTGAKLINELQPDIVFLDIQMPKVDGFEMLELLDKLPMVIFCTAYDRFAIKAFEKNAVDYLLKPFTKERLLAAIARLNAPQGGAAAQDIPSTADYRAPLTRIVVKDRKEIVIIKVNDLIYLEAQDDYVALHTARGKWLKQQTMKYYETALDAGRFVRVHRRYLVAIEQIAKLDKLGKETYLAVLQTGAEIPVSTTGYQKLKAQLGI